MEEENQEEEQSIYSVAIHYLDERETEHIENLNKNAAIIIANTLKIDVEQKKEYATIEIDEKDFYIFRMLNIKDISSINVDGDE